MTYEFEYPAFPEHLPELEQEVGKYRVRFARNIDDLDEVLRLRYEVFNVEMGEGLAASEATERDLDPHDPTWHHIVVCLIKTGAIIGTYRVQTNEAAAGGIGFYTNEEFHLEDLPAEIRGNVVEAGRACIAKKHRNGKVLFLLWLGLAHYLKHNQKRWLFGCCSLTSQDPEEGLSMYEYLQKSDGLWAEYDARPRADFVCEIPPNTLRTYPNVKVPRLMRIYLNYGMRIASRPAIDRAFKTIDYLLLADRTKMTGGIFRDLDKI